MFQCEDTLARHGQRAGVTIGNTTYLTRDVNVWYANSTTPGGFIDLKNYENESVCGRDQLAYVEFISDRGDVPMLVATTSPYSSDNAKYKRVAERHQRERGMLGQRPMQSGRGRLQLSGRLRKSSDVKKKKFGEYGERGDCAFRHGGTKDEKWFTSADTDPGYEYLFEVSADGTEGGSATCRGGGGARVPGERGLGVSLSLSWVLRARVSYRPCAPVGHAVLNYGFSRRFFWPGRLLCAVPRSRETTVD